MEKVRKNGLGKNPEIMTKKSQNEIAISNSVKEDNHIYFDYKTPLVINNNLKVMELFVLRDEDFDEEKEELECCTSSFDTLKKVRIVFQDENKKYIEDRSDEEKMPYITDIFVIISLDELVERLAQCTDESDIEDILE